MLHIKILSLGSPERYAVRRLVTTAQNELQTVDPKLEITITEVNEAEKIGRYATVLVMPTLVINEKVVCSGRFPNKEEIVCWIQTAAREQ